MGISTDAMGMTDTLRRILAKMNSNPRFKFSNRNTNKKQKAVNKNSSNSNSIEVGNSKSLELVDDVIKLPVSI